MTPAEALPCTLALPANFRVAELLAFHRRDSQALAERVEAQQLRKGLIWHGEPACLQLEFDTTQVRAELRWQHRAGHADDGALAALLRHLLGLQQDIEGFEARHGGHPQLGALLARQRGLRVAQAATPFEALSWAITGQQISLAAALSLRRRLILACGVAAGHGLLCYPDARAVAALPVETLRQAGFSASKTRTLQSVAQQVLDGTLALDDWLLTRPIEVIRQRLLAVRGIGPWTVDYTLLRGYGWLDGSLHGDAAVRRALQGLLGSTQRIEAAQAQDWLATFAPWRALLAAHLWAMSSTAA